MKTTTRRSFLQSAAGATLALPWLDSLAAADQVSIKPAQRLAIFYVPNGVVRRGFFPGEQDERIPGTRTRPNEYSTETTVPVGVHALDTLTPTQEPLQQVKDKVTLITGMDRTFRMGSDVHAQCGSCFLSSAAPDSVTSSIYPLERTLDHIVGDHIGDATPFRTMELSCNSHHDNKESIYFDNISWYGAGHVAPSIRDPRQAYRRLFGTDRIHEFELVTDLVLEDARSLRHQLGQHDQEKFAEYFDGIRTIEQQISKLEEKRDDIAKHTPGEPPDVHLPRGEYIRLMGDLMVTALQAGLTKVATLMVGPERWDTSLTYESLFAEPVSHHQMSHNQKKYLQELLQLDIFHMQHYAYLLEKMDRIQESDGSSLLDNTIFTFGGGLGDGATHQYTDLPIIVAGSGGGQLKTGLHVHCAKGTELANLWLTHAQVMGVPGERFADSTGVIKDLLAS